MRLKNDHSWASRYDNINLLRKDRAVSYISTEGVARLFSRYSFSRRAISRRRRKLVAALSTWFDDENEEPIVFTASPVIIYDIVIWEIRRKAARTLAEKLVTQFSHQTIPSNFVELAVKVS